MYPTLETPIQSDYILLRDLTPLAIVEVAQSKRDLNLQDEMGLFTAFIELPVGAGPSNFSDYTKK